jgi:hypothetical protein
MAKHAKYKKIHKNKFYHPHELAFVTGLSNISIYKDIQEGLSADTDSIPYLIYGEDAINYYEKKYWRPKVKTGPTEIFCLGCSACVLIFDIPTLEVIITGYKYSENKHQVQLLGRCPKCNLKFSRLRPYISRKEFDKKSRISIEDYTEGGCK